jgi:hypothetical protein
MKYKIKYRYKTGDSFHTEEKERLLEYEWENLEVAKECLKRIGEHYKWYASKTNPWGDEIEKPSWHNIKDGPFIDESNVYNLLNLPMDNGEEVQFWAPWCGHFETLHGAEIILDPTDMSFDLD